MQAVITRNQTPLERVRELSAAIGTEIKRFDPAQVAKAINAVDPSPLAPSRAVEGQQKRSEQLPNQERGRSW